MKPARFEYLVPRDVPETLRILAENPGSARLLAGGQSLMPLLNMRMASPAILVDINRIEALAGIADHGAFVRIGAMVRYHALQESPLVAAEFPLMTVALQHVAHPAIRNRGTLGGSLALADPAAEMPAVALALAATIVAHSVRGERRIPIDDFLRGTWETALAEDEMIVAVDYPKQPAGARFAFREFARRHGDFALAGLILIAAGGEARCVVFGVGSRALRIAGVEAWLAADPTASAAPPQIRALLAEAVAAAEQGGEEAETRATLATTLFERMLPSLAAPAVAA